MAIAAEVPCGRRIAAAPQRCADSPNAGNHPWYICGSSALGCQRDWLPEICTRSRRGTATSVWCFTSAQQRSERLGQQSRHQRHYPEGTPVKHTPSGATDRTATCRAWVSRGRTAPVTEFLGAQFQRDGQRRPEARDRCTALAIAAVGVAAASPASACSGDAPRRSWATMPDNSPERWLRAGRRDPAPALSGWLQTPDTRPELQRPGGLPPQLLLIRRAADDKSTQQPNAKDQYARANDHTDRTAHDDADGQSGQCADADPGLRPASTGCRSRPGDQEAVAAACCHLAAAARLPYR